MVYGDLVAMATSDDELRRKLKVTKRAAPGGILTLLGKELRRRRRKKKLTQVNLSVEAGLSPNVVGRIERGIYNPTIVVLHAIATRLGIRVTDLFPNTDFLNIRRGLQHEDNFPTAWITELRWRRV
jgi:transcriptional regulator with XRE-family HTH domain